MNVLLKLAGPLVTLAAGFVGAKVVDLAWTKFTGSRPPQPGDTEANVKSSLRKTLAFAIISAAVGAAIEVLTGHGTRIAISRLTQNEDKASPAARSGRPRAGRTGGVASLAVLFGPVLRHHRATTWSSSSTSSISFFQVLGAVAGPAHHVALTRRGEQLEEPGHQQHGPAPRCAFGSPAPTAAGTGPAPAVSWPHASG